MNKYTLLLAIALCTYNIQAQGIKEKTFTTQSENTKSNFKQELSVKWISENTISYTLVFQSGECSTNLAGNAVLQKLNRSNELEVSSYKGTSFSVHRYIDNSKKGVDVLLRIDAVDKDKAKVELLSKDDRDLSDDCNDIEVVMITK